MKKLINLVLLATFFSGPLMAEQDSFTFPVRHDHFWGSGTGELILTTRRVIYRSEEDEKHAREWAYEDIQEVKVASSTKVEILTYKDVGWKLNADRKFNFELVNAEMSPQAVRFLRQHATSGVVAAVFVPSEDIFYRVPAKHRHTLSGGCQGELLFSDAGLYYSSPSNREHDRYWPIESIESIGRMSSSSFRITVPEKVATGGSRNFQFQLKRPLSQEAYQRFWRNVYEPESWLSRASDGKDG